MRKFALGFLKNYLTCSIIHIYCKSLFTVILNHSFLSANFNCDNFYFNLLPFALIRRQKGISTFLNEYPNKKDKI